MVWNVEYVILGVDPGQTTGFFSVHKFWIDGESFISTDAFQVDYSELCNFAMKYPLQCHSNDQNNATPLHVSIEQYFITQRTAQLTRQPEALKATGVVETCLPVYWPTVYQPYTPVHVSQKAKSNIAKFASDDMLKRLRWYCPDGPHANDAARQAYATLMDVDFPMWQKIYEEAMTEEEG